MISISRLSAANYHYKRYSLDYFLDSVERLGYETIELWASGPHLHLEDFSLGRLNEVKKKIESHNLKLICFTPEQCLYPISVSHPDKVYRDRSIDFFCKHIEAAAALGCNRMVMSTGISYLDVDPQKAWEWCVDAFQKICQKAEREGVYLATEPFTKYTTNICNNISQLKQLIKEVDSPMLKGLADTDVIATTGTDSIDDFIKTLGEDLNHVHFLDGNPGGHLVPGDGKLDLKHVLKVLDQVGYKGYLALEILDRRYVMEPEKALKAAMDWYKKNAL
ncbi:sugar phosphate isomerase/epimerase family protein [Clostridium neuense]|uniref:Sugar phosphate isomerase/epimerase family protein n=1 Tax=Clostridium neuense TaxID=1728934 RepID=A0ABW8THI5_9CLOT